MPSIESSFSVFSAQGPTKFDDADVASLMVLNEYLSTMEGPFWKQVRGAGLAYGCSLRLNIESGLLSFVIYRSPNAFEAFKKVQEIVQQFADGHQSFDRTAMDAAKSSVLFSIIAREDSASGAAYEKFVNEHFRGVQHSANEQLLAQVERVTLDGMSRMLTRYLVPLFQPTSSVGCVTTSPNKVQDIRTGFESLQFEVESISL